MTTTQRRPAAISGLRGETVAVGGLDLHYRIGGDPDGPPVILWHGFLSTGYAWRDVAPALAAAGLAVLVPDMRGYGDSGKPEGDEGYDARALAEEMRALVAAIGFGGGRPIILAAHDMGALPALIWAADHPSEVAGLLYIEAPVMLGEVLRQVIAYTPDAMAAGSMWWWVLPLAPGVPERLIVGSERAFLGWFYEGPATVRKQAFTPAVVDEVLRTFSGRAGVLGSLGVYRAAFTSIAQTEPLETHRIAVPVVAMGGEKGLGAKVGEGVRRVAARVDAVVEPDCGHFLPEEAPDAVIRRVLAMAGRRRPRHLTGDHPMTDAAPSSIPADDPARSLTVAGPDDPGVRHVSVVGDTYTILVSGAQTAGRYCLIDMIVPAGGGPPPHRHDFEEMFTLLEGELDFTFRGETRTVKAGETVNVPANAPHVFKNNSGTTAHMLCLCAPAGQEEFFMAIGVPLESRTDAAPEPSAAEKAEKGKLLESLLPRYRTEMVKP